MYRILILFLFISSIIFARTKLIYPTNVKDMQELNKEEEDKLKNISIKRSSTIDIPEQYKGSLKFTESEPDANWRDFRVMLGFSALISFIPDFEMKAIDEPISIPSVPGNFTKSATWSSPVNYSYSLMAGIYWINGVRFEFDYSKKTLEIKNFTNGFKKVNDTIWGDVIFNEYLQKSATITRYLTEDGIEEHDRLSGNMLPLVEITVQTYMGNIILEQVYAKSKFRPYIGIGAGLVSVDASSLETDGAFTTIGGQFLVGFSYPITLEEKIIIFLGYRGVFFPTVKQKMKRVTGVNCIANGTCVADGVYYNPIIEEIEQKYNIQFHNFDLTARFMF
jgi:hypothetical protein